MVDPFLGGISAFVNNGPPPAIYGAPDEIRFIDNEKVSYLFA